MTAPQQLFPGPEYHHPNTLANHPEPLKPGCNYIGCTSGATVTVDGLNGRRCAKHPPILADTAPPATAARKEPK